MVNYSCPRCGYKTNHFVTYKRHLSRKKLCENILSDDTLENEYLKYNITEKIKNLNLLSSQQKVNKKSTLSNSSQQKVNKKSTLLEDYICEYCEKEFNFKQSYYRHLKTCKIKKEKSELNNVVELLNKQLDDQHKQLEDQKNQINELIKNSGTTNITYNQQNNTFLLLNCVETNIGQKLSRIELARKNYFPPLNNFLF